MDFQVKSFAPFRQVVTGAISISTKCHHPSTITQANNGRPVAITFTVREFDETVKVFTAVKAEAKCGTFLAATSSQFIYVNYLLSDVEDYFADVTVELFDAQELANARLNKRGFDMTSGSIDSLDKFFKLMTWRLSDGIRHQFKQLKQQQAESGVNCGLIAIEAMVEEDMQRLLRVATETMKANATELYEKGQHSTGFRVTGITFAENTAKALSTSNTPNSYVPEKKYNLPDSREMETRHSAAPSSSTQIQDAERKPKAVIVLNAEERSTIQAVNKKILRKAMAEFRKVFFRKGLFCSKVNNALLRFRRDVINWMDALLGEFGYFVEAIAKDRKSIEDKLGGKARVLLGEMLRCADVSEVFHDELVETFFGIWNNLGNKIAIRELTPEFIKKLLQK